MNKVIEELMEQIAKAEQEAFKKGIETNTIMLNEELDYCKEFSTAVRIQGQNRVYVVPAMIMGKHVFKGKLPSNYSFAIANTSYETDLEYYKKRCEELESKLFELKELLTCAEK